MTRTCACACGTLVIWSCARVAPVYTWQPGDLAFVESVGRGDTTSRPGRVFRALAQTHTQLVEFTLVRLTPAESDFRWQVFDATMRTEVGRRTGLSYEELRSLITGQLAQGLHDAILVDGDWIGVLSVTESDEAVALHQIEILPAFQGSGIGGTVIDWLIRHAEAKGKPVSLRVFRQNNRARQLYQRLGFIVIGAEHDDLIMQAGGRQANGKRDSPTAQT